MTMPKKVEKFDFDNKTIVITTKAQILALEQGIDIDHLIWELKSFMHHLDLPLVIVKVRDNWLTFQVGFKPRVILK